MTEDEGLTLKAFPDYILIIVYNCEAKHSWPTSLIVGCSPVRISTQLTIMKGQCTQSRLFLHAEFTALQLVTRPDRIKGVTAA